MTTAIDLAIVGAGVVGCALAWTLAPHFPEIFVFEKNPGVTRGENQSSRNSGVIHSGIYYDRATRPLKARLCVDGNRRLYAFCRRYEVPALKTGKLLVATGPEDMAALELYLARAGENGLEDVRLLSASEATRLEPHVQARAALLIPSAGIVEPTALVRCLGALAGRAGVTFLTATEVLGAEPQAQGINLRFRYRDGQKDAVTARLVINAGGVDADRLARSLNPASPYMLDPVRGESYCFYARRRPGLRVGMNVYPTPEFVATPHGRHFTVGVHLTPTLGGLGWPPVLGDTVLVGPRLVSVPDRTAPLTASVPPEVFAAKVRPFLPALTAEDLVWHQAGIQARLRDQPDFVIRPDAAHPNVIHLLGIDSPGLTSCLAIAAEVAALLRPMNA